MVIEFQTFEGPRGRAWVEDGRVVTSNENLKRLLEETPVIDLEARAELTPADGERFLEWLPATFRGSRFVAVEVED